jgi:hypothetical protein
MQLISYISAVLALPLLALVKIYQLVISPMLGPQCRFHPSCSEYTRQALKQHGAFAGSWLAIKRIVKCQPMHPGGIDNVPPPKHKAKSIKHSDQDTTIKNQH